MSKRQGILNELKDLLTELDTMNEALAAIRIAEAIALLESEQMERDEDQK